MCRPMFSTLSSGSGRSGCLGSSTTSGRRDATAGLRAGEGEAAGVASADPGDEGADTVPVAGLFGAAALGAPAAQPATLQIETTLAQTPTRERIGLVTQKRISRVITDFTGESIWFERDAECGRSGDMRRRSRTARFPRFPRLAASALLLGCAAFPSACEERGKPQRVPSPPKVAPVAAAAPSASARQPSAAPRDSEPTPQLLNVSEIPDEARAATPASPEPSFKSKLVIEQPQEIGPAGQMSASERGVVMINRADEVQLAKRLAGGSERARFSTIKGGPNEFFAVARGPLLLRGKAYWVKDGKLVRRAQDNATPLEILASDARNGTRVAGLDLPDAPTHAVYISNPVADDAPPRAKLWVEGSENIVLSPEGAGASSIAVANAGQDLFTVAIDARSAMTPMHGRRVHFKSGKAELGPDVVMWVGSTSQMLSEVFAVTTPLGVRAFLPIERDTSHFGLVMLDLGSEPHMDPKTVWRGYPNGIDVAPVASASFCGSSFVAYVRPENARPEARQLLEVAEITETGLGQAETVGGALGFANVSLAAATNSAVLAYVADFRTFATQLRCSHQK